MTKSEFLMALAEKLSEDLPAEAVTQELRYYEGFIDGEIGRGLDEETVTDRLGDPILIARNITESPRESLVYNDDSYQEGFTESRYQEVRETSDWVKREVETVYDAGEKKPLEKAVEKAGEKAEDFDRRRKSQDDGAKAEEKAEEKAARKAFISAIFTRADGSLNWKLIGTLAVIALVVVLVVVSLVKVVTFLFPVIIVLVVIWLLYVFFIDRRKQ